MLNRKQMEDTIRSGSSVMVGGRIISKIENLPSAAQLATTDEEKQAAASDLDAQIEALQKQKAALAEDDGKTEKADDSKTEDGRTDVLTDGKTERTEDGKTEKPEETKSKKK